MLGLIWAQANNGVIGRDNAIPWRIPEDTAHFKNVTTGHPVIMGRRTWDSLPPRFRPLSDRRNIVVTRDTDWSAEGAEVVHSLDDALRTAGEGEVWVIGGGEVYAAALGRADRVAVTEIDLDVDGDAFAPTLGPEWVVADSGEWLVSSRDGARFRFVIFTRS
ncbi:dihydrofolate reductase [Rhodococcus triatomae]|nr:dihydrofolate reductase [Rhodococcus triatomae BKS 15-14]